MKNKINDLITRVTEQISHAINTNDVEHERECWIVLFDILRLLSPQQIEQGMSMGLGEHSDIQKVAFLMERLIKYGFHKSDDPTIEAVFSAVLDAFFTHASPELRQTMREGIWKFIPALKPAGCHSTGYSGSSA